MHFSRPVPFSWRSVAAVLALASASLQAETSWIWADGPGSKPAANLRKSFEVTGPLKEAVLVVTCDNGAKVFLDGELVVTNPDWSEPSKVNLTRKLKAGRHELRAECKNEGDIAGFVARLTLKDNDGKQTVIESDGSWEASLPGKSDWKPAKVLAKYGDQPWGNALSGAAAPGKPATAPVIAPSDIKLLPGFRAELIYAVPKSQQGSWVSMTVDPKGRLVACDQGGGLYRLTLAAPGSSAPATIEKLKNAVGGAHGLLHAFGSLYVMVNEQGGRQG
ncbi:MAG: heme-binding protein, partial [Verrucomicrobiota bacterium]